MESLALEERVRIAIATGESYFREFKSATAGPPDDRSPRKPQDIMTDIGRTLVAFANADGGELIIGVEDDGTVTGVPHNDEQVRQILDATRTHVHAGTPLPTPRKTMVTIGGHHLIYFYVPKGTEYIYLTSDGRCLRRADRESVPVPVEAISGARLEETSRAYDRSFTWPTATLSDLDLDLVSSVAAQVAYGISPEKLLQYLDLAEFSADGLRMRNAALLLFAKNVSRWHARCQVRITSYKGNVAQPGRDFVILKDDVIVGNILQLTEVAWERLQVAISQQTTLTENAHFEQTYLYPQVACREALINAIVHRNYAVEGRGVEIALFSDRMEILSPGALLSTITLRGLQQLKGEHESRNPLVARVLREVGLVREMGEGVRRIFEVMRSSALATPELLSDDATFTVTLRNRSLYSESVQVWLSMFEELELDEPRRAVLALGYGGAEFSTQDVIDRLGLVDVDLVRETLTPLRQAGVLVRTKNDAQMMAVARKQGIPKRSIPRFQVVAPRQERSSTDTSVAAVSSPRQLTPADQSTAVAVEDMGGTIEIYLGNLPFDVDKADLVAWLVDDCEVDSIDFPGAKSADHKNAGFAFVTVSVTAESAVGLISRLDGSILGGRQVRAQLPRKLG